MNPPERAKAILLCVDEKSQAQELDIATGKVIGSCRQNHRHQEFLGFLRKIDREVPAHLDIHLVLDNHATHKTPAVAEWCKKHPRYHLHFTPASASWLNRIERWLAKITEQRIRRAAFKRLPDLKQAILDYIDENNKNPKPFLWTATADLILGKVKSICSRINLSGH